MTDDLHPDTEIASAYLDGEATAEEIARVESDPELLASVEDLRDLRARLAATPAPAGLLDDHVAAALSTFAEADPVDDAPEGTVTTPVADLRSRRRWHQRLPLGAVAAAVVVLALVGFITQIDFDGGDDLATSADTASQETSDDSADGDDAGSAGGEDSAANPAADPTDGSDEPLAEESAGSGTAPDAGRSRLAFIDTDALAEHVAERAGTFSETATTSASELDTADGGQRAQPCDVLAVSGVEPAAISLVLPAVVAGEDVTAVVTDDDPPRLVIVAEAACEVIDDRGL